MSGHTCSLATITGAILSLLAQPAAHAEEQQDAIERCAGIADATTRIRCLEDTIRRLSGPASGDNGSAMLDSGPAAPASVTPVAPPAEPAAALGSEEPAGEATRQAVPPKEAGTPPAAQVAERPAQADKDTTLDRMGSEQVPRETEEEDLAGVRISTRVLAFDFVGRNKLRMRLENGQIWRQIDADRGDFYPLLRGKDNFPVELWQTSLGGYRMRFVPGNRTVRVRRIE